MYKIYDFFFEKGIKYRRCFYFQRQSLHALNSKRKPKLAMNCVVVVFKHIIVRHDGVHHSGEFLFFKMLE